MADLPMIVDPRPVILAALDVRDQTDPLVCAVRATVDLHSPDSPDTPNPDFSCRGCHVPGETFVWPENCPTIAAIAAAMGIRTAP